MGDLNSKFSVHTSSLLFLLPIDLFVSPIDISTSVNFKFIIISLPFHTVLIYVHIARDRSLDSSSIPASWPLHGELPSSRSASPFVLAFLPRGPCHDSLLLHLLSPSAGMFSHPIILLNTSFQDFFWIHLFFWAFSESLGQITCSFSILFYTLCIPLLKCETQGKWLPLLYSRF